MLMVTAFCGVGLVLGLLIGDRKNRPLTICTGISFMMFFPSAPIAGIAW